MKIILTLTIILQAAVLFAAPVKYTDKDGVWTKETNRNGVTISALIKPSAAYTSRRNAEKGGITVSCTAKDTDGDGTADIKKGSGAAGFTLQLARRDGKPWAKSGLKITARTDHGSLDKLSAMTDINGKAAFRLTASDETVWTRVVFSCEGFMPGEISLVFVP